MKSTSTLLRDFTADKIQNWERLKTGFSDFDDIIGGLPLGQLIVMAERHGMGTDDLIRCIVLNTSIKFNNGVGVISLDQSPETYLERLICTYAGASYFLFKNGKYSKEFEKVFEDVIQEIRSAPLYIEDEISYDFSYLISKLYDFKRIFDIRLLVIHGFNHLEFKNESIISREEKLNTISKKLSELAKNMNITVIVKATIPEVKHSIYDQDLLPTIDELFNYVPITRYADLVTTLYRPRYFGYKTWDDSEESCESEAEWAILKNKHGNLSQKFRLTYQGHISRFHEVDDVRFKKQPWVAKT